MTSFLLESVVDLGEGPSPGHLPLLAISLMSPHHCVPLALSLPISRPRLWLGVSLWAAVPSFGSHGESVMRRLRAYCTLWDLVPGLCPLLPFLCPFLSVLSGTVPGLCRDGKRNKDFTRTSKKGPHAPWESAGQGPADEGKRGSGQETVHSLTSQFLSHGKTMGTLTILTLEKK